MIGEEVGITHVSILNYFSNKVEIAGKTIRDYSIGLQKLCYDTLKDFPVQIADNKYYRNMLWWTLHFKLLSENSTFRRFYISFYREGPITLTQSIHSLEISDIPFLQLTIPETKVFINRSLGTAIDACLSNLMDLNVITYTQATEMMIRQVNSLGVNLTQMPDETEIKNFVDTYMPSRKIDVLNEILLADYSR